MRNEKILILGGTGMLGHKLLQVMSDEFITAVTVKSDAGRLERSGFVNDTRIFENVDSNNIELIEKTVRDFKPDFIINAIGIIKQLPESKNEFLTLDINSLFPRRLAQIAGKHSFKLINISTDCVFSGKSGNYSEDDFSDAEDLYGKSKFLGETTGENCLTIRTSIIGRELYTEHSLVEWFLNNTEQSVKGFTKAVFSGFPTLVLAEIIKDIIIDFPQTEGLYHVSSDPINKYDLLGLIKENFKVSTEIVPFNDFVIDRSLDSTKFRQLTGFRPDSWEEMIKRMAEDSKPYDKWRTQIS